MPWISFRRDVRPDTETAPVAAPCIELLESRSLLSAWGPVAQAVGQPQIAARFPNLDGSGQTVAVIDSGVDYNHPALGGGWGNTVIDGYDFIGNSTDPMDQFGHGTAVSGIIAASGFTLNGKYYQGIAPGVKIVALRVVDVDGNTTDSNISQALQWVIDHRTQYNITAVNMSVGDGTFWSKTSQSAYGDQLATLAQAGVVITAPTGNSGQSNGINYPAADPNVLAVGSINRLNAISGFTSRGAALDLLAPGRFVPTTLYDIFNGSESYGPVTGTSFATPYVTGAAVLLKQLNPRLTGPSILHLLQVTGTPVTDPATGMVFRQLNIYTALVAEDNLLKYYRSRGTKLKATPAVGAATSPPKAVAASPQRKAASLFNSGNPILAVLG